MRNYSYTFYDNDGKIKKRFLRAYSLPDAENILITQRITIIDVDECETTPGEYRSQPPATAAYAAKAETGGETLKSLTEAYKFSLLSNIKILLTRKLNYDEFIIFLKQFTVLLKSGINILPGLDLLAQNAKDPVLKKYLHNIVNEIYNGASVYSAFNKQKDIFPKVFVNLIFAGETGGDLPKVLSNLADYYEKEREIKKKATSALTYPAVVLSFAFLAAIFLGYYIFPGFVTIYKNFNVELPLTTKILLFIIGLLKKPAFIISVFVIAPLLIFITGAYVKTPTGKHQLDLLASVTPILNNINKKVLLARFARTVGTLYDDGISLHKCLEITAQTINNTLYKKALDDVLNEVIDSGVPLSESLMKRPYFFPTIFVNLVAVGEESGEIGYMLKKTALYYEEEVFYIFDNFVNLIEPFIIAILGSLVLFIMLSLFLPLYNLINQFTAGR